MKEISVNELSLNPMTLIGNEWMLITAGNEERGYNTMTASWGHLGSLWGHPTSVVYVRPQRYTKEFIDREAYYTLSFFPESYHKALGYLGTHSGRDGDKVAAVGLTPVSDACGTWFKEASLVLVCRKLYRAPLVEEGFLDRRVLDSHYPERDLHDLYVGEIVRVLVADPTEGGAT